MTTQTEEKATSLVCQPKALFCTCQEVGWSDQEAYAKKIRDVYPVFFGKSPAPSGLKVSRSRYRPTAQLQAFSCMLQMAFKAPSNP